MSRHISSITLMLVAWLALIDACAADEFDELRRRVEQLESERQGFEQLPFGTPVDGAALERTAGRTLPQAAFPVRY